MIFLMIYAVWNGVVATVYVFDKFRAIRGKKRISERWLLTLAVLMGALGAFVGVFLFNHKTRKPKFVVGVPLLIVLNLLVVWIIRIYMGG